MYFGPIFYLLHQKYCVVVQIMQVTWGFIVLPVVCWKDTLQSCGVLVTEVLPDWRILPSTPWYFFFSYSPPHFFFAKKTQSNIRFCVLASMFTVGFCFPIYGGLDMKGTCQLDSPKLGNTSNFLVLFSHCNDLILHFPNYGIFLPRFPKKCSTIWIFCVSLLH